MIDKGVLYCATGEHYLAKANLSRESLKKIHPGIKTAVATPDKIDPGAGWDVVFPLRNEDDIPEKLKMHYKLQALLNSPFRKTLYLDSDTYILNPIDDLFQLLDRFEWLICHGHDRKKRFDIYTGRGLPGVHQNPKGEKIPYAFSPLQGGVIAYKQNEKIRNFLMALNRKFIDKDFYDDQYSIRELLWQSDISFYILPREYNFNSISDLKRWRKNHYAEAIPRIFHYTKHKKKDIPKLVHKYFDPYHSDWRELSSGFTWIPKNIRRMIKTMFR